MKKEIMVVTDLELVNRVKKGDIMNKTDNLTDEDWKRLCRMSDTAR